MVKRDSNFNPLHKSRGIDRGRGDTADWATATATTVIRAITTAANTGGAVRFGYSRDGGAYAVGIYGDGEPYTEFVKPSEDIDDFLEKVIRLFSDIADDRVTSAKATEQAK